MAKKRTKVKFNNLEGCSEKMLAAVDGNKLMARGVQDAADRVRWTQGADPIGGADNFRDLDLNACLIFSCIKPLGVCCYCGGIMTGSLREYQFKNAALTFLLQKGMIGEKRVKTPTLDEIIETITNEKEGMFIEFDYRCSGCGDDTQHMIIGGHTDPNPEVKTPRLVG